MIPVLGPYYKYGTSYLGHPKRDLNFDNHQQDPKSLLAMLAGQLCAGFESEQKSFGLAGSPLEALGTTTLHPNYPKLPQNQKF